MNGWDMIANLPAAAQAGLAGLALVQVVLLGAGLWRLSTLPISQIVGGSRWPWLAVIALVNIVGPAVFLVLHRGAGQSPAPASARTTTPSDAAAALESLLPPAAPTADSGPLLTVDHLSKVYRAGPSTVAAVNDVSFTVPAGSIFGFVGRNGAGKTTTLRLITALAHPTSGSVLLSGRPTTDPAARRHLAFVPDVPAFYPWMTAAEALTFAAELRGIPATTAVVAEMQELAGLGGNTRPVGTYSRGMRQRLAIVQSLIARPRLLMLDEPTSALDPLGRRDVLDLVARLAGRVTVLFSSHILADVEEVSTHVAVVDTGRLRAAGPLDSVRALAPIRPGFELTVQRDAPTVATALAAAPWCASAQATSSVHVSLTLTSPSLSDDAAGALPGILAAAGTGLRELTARTPTLADAFYALADQPGTVQEASA